MKSLATPSAALFAVAMVLLTGCGKSPALENPVGAASQPVEVGVLKMTPTSVILSKDLPGRVSAYRMAEVRARVSGIVLRRFFTEGSNVKEGDLLYQIDPASYEAALENAKGALARAEANVEGARLKEQRYRQLAATKAISRQDYDDAAVALHAFEAEVISARAALRTAEISLGYTKVTSPVSGRIGLSQVTEGAYVQESAATLMARVQQLDPVYVDVTQSSNELLRFRRQVASGEIQTDETGQTRVQLTFDDGSRHEEDGVLQFSDVTVEADTSSVIVRAIFPNPRAVLLPGMFVRARLLEGQKSDAILVPQLAVTRNAKGEAIAYVVGGDGRAELRVIETASSIGNQWLVSVGLKAGDQVIVTNLQRVRPGTLVKATQAELAAIYQPKISAPVN